MSSARVTRLDDAGVPVYYLKSAPNRPFGGLEAERDVMAWLDGRLDAPRVAAWAPGHGQDHLLMTAALGTDARVLDATTTPSEAVGAIALALRSVHELPARGCPFGWSVDAVLAAARVNVADGLVDQSRFDEERRGRTSADLLAEAVATRPLDEGDPVFTHGDPSMGNFIMHGAAVSGIVDWPWGGVGDPYADLAVAAHSIRHRFGPDAESRFFAAYGLEVPDEERLAFYRLAAELF